MLCGLNEIPYLFSRIFHLNFDILRNFGDFDVKRKEKKNIFRFITKYYEWEFGALFLSIISKNNFFNNNSKQFGR